MANATQGHIETMRAPAFALRALMNCERVQAPCRGLFAVLYYESIRTMAGIKLVLVAKRLVSEWKTVTDVDRRVTECSTLPADKKDQPVVGTARATTRQGAGRTLDCICHFLAPFQLKCGSTRTRAAVRNLNLGAPLFWGGGPRRFPRL